MPDSGLQVNESASAFIGLENNVVGTTFKELVVRAVQDAKK